MTTRRYHATTAVLAAATATAAMLLASPDSHADDVVFIGGTGTGIVPQGDPHSLVDPFVPHVDHLTAPVYDGSPIANPQAAVPAIAPIVAAQPNPTVVIGLSKGAQVAHGVEAVDTRTDTRYVYIGDPDGENGLSHRLGTSPKPAAPTHNTHTITGEYDGFADVPDRFNPLAIANAAAGIVFVHTQYGTGSADDPLTRIGNGRTTVKRNPNGTTSTTTLIPTAHLPLLKPLRDTELTLTRQSAMTDALEAAIRPAIDAGYSRNDAPKAVKAGTTGNATSDNASTSHNATSSTAGASDE